MNLTSSRFGSSRITKFGSNICQTMSRYENHERIGSVVPDVEIRLASIKPNFPLATVIQNPKYRIGVQLNATRAVVAER